MIMLRDTNDFRQRYQRWKNGEKVYENGRILPYQDDIPEYKGGKNSYKSKYSGIVLDYIKAVENPYNHGYNPKNDTWWVSTAKGDDPHGIGFGLDLRYNKNITAPLSTSAMLQVVDKNLDYFANAARRNIKNFDRLSDKKKALILGSMYRGDAQKFVYKQPWSILSDEGAAEAVSDYYDRLKMARGRQTRAFFNQPRLSKPIHDIIYEPVRVPEIPKPNIIKETPVIPFAPSEPTQEQIDAEKFTFAEPTKQKSIFDAIQLINSVLKPFDPLKL